MKSSKRRRKKLTPNELLALIDSPLLALNELKLRELNLNELALRDLMLKASQRKIEKKFNFFSVFWQILVKNFGIPKN